MAKSLLGWANPDHPSIVLHHATNAIHQAMNPRLEVDGRVLTKLARMTEIQLAIKTIMELASTTLDDRAVEAPTHGPTKI